MPDPLDSMFNSFTPASIAEALEGGLPVASEERPPPISLCEMGPCAHYHVIRTKVDAQEPQDGSAAPIFTIPTRTCYPASGIECDLTDTPVKECNLWLPNADLVQVRIRERERFKTANAEQYAAFEASWPSKCQNCGKVDAVRQVGSERWCADCVAGPGTAGTP